MQNATNFRECRRGSAPADWTAGWTTANGSFRVNAIEMDPARETWLEPFSLGAGGRARLTWDAADGDAGRANQEARARWLLAADADVAHLRVSGVAGAENAYVLRAEAGALQILSVVAGTRTLLATVAIAHAVGSYRSFRFRANTTAGVTTLSGKSWSTSSAEPGAWDLSVVNNALADGSLGVGIEDGSDPPGLLLFFAYGTNGDSAPPESFIPAGIAEWSTDHGVEAELTAEIEVFDPAAQTLSSVFVSTRGRRTGPSDFPPATQMRALLLDPGSLSVPLSGDDLDPALPQGMLTSSLGSASVRNPLIERGARLERALVAIFDGTMAGRRYTVRAGRREWTTHRWFEPVFSSIIAGEPVSGDPITIALADPLAQLQNTLTTRRHVGIETALKLTFSTEVAPHLSDYDLTSFTVMFRFSIPAPPSASTGPYKGDDSVGIENFALLVEQGTGKVQARSSCGGVPSAINLKSAATYSDGAFHLAIYAVDGASSAWLIVDNDLIGEIVPPGVVDTPAYGVHLADHNNGITVLDVRLYSYAMGQDEARTAAQKLADPSDPGVVAMWRCDDGAFGVVTDYGPLANHVTLSGAPGVNYDWVPSKLGNASLAGNAMPQAYGAVFNAPAVKIDAGRSIFRMADADVSGLLPVVKAKGVVLVPTTDYNLDSDGAVTFVSAQSEPVTWDVTPGQASSGMGPVLRAALVDRAGFAPESLDLDSVTIVGQVLPYEVALFSAAEMTGQAFLDAVLAPAGGHYRVDRDARLTLGALLPPITPGPYPGEPALEFSGLPHSRVFFDGDYGGGFSGSFTLVWWVLTYSTERRPERDTDPNPNRQVVAQKGDGVTAGYQVAIYQPMQGAIRVSLPGLSSATLVTGPGAVAWGVWTMCACRYDQAGGVLSILTLPKGGSLVTRVASTGVTGSVTLGTGALQLGGALGLGSVNGSVQHFQVWGSALSNAVLQELAAVAPVGTETGLLFNPHLTDGRGSAVTDAVSGAKGSVHGSRWAPRAVFDFYRGLSKSSLKVKRLRPAWDARMTYAVNQSPMQDADIAGVGVTAAEKVALKRASQVAPSPARDVLRDYRAARIIEQTTALMNGTDANALARNTRLRHSPDRIIAQIVDAPRMALSLALTDEIWVYHPDLPPQGAALRVVGLTPALAKMRFAIDGWGHHLDGSGELLLDGSGDRLLVDAPDDRLELR